jgi:16S rRNA (uracil1498-N3)-methyltransferase
LFSILIFMALPFFYVEALAAGASSIVLNEDTSKHVVQVLRMQNGDQLQLTDGRGNLFAAEITDNHKRNCTVKITATTFAEAPLKKITIAISLVKNSHRFEWFLEKATEIGVAEIIPLVCERTEKQHFRHDRMKGIVISAMQQSQQAWLPLLHEPARFTDTISHAVQQQKFIAHCEDEGDKTQLAKEVLNQPSGILILIGPEGDFTKHEIGWAILHQFRPVALGNTRLRTETAGVVAAALLCNK